jgi:hypothetical protein
MWSCKCDCGNETISRCSDLISGKIKSCGCLLKETSCVNILKAIPISAKQRDKSFQDISGRYLSSVKHRAMTHKLEYSISPKYLWELYLKQNKKCALSGLDIFFHKFSSLIQTSSLDRIDSNKGYVEGNVQWVHKDLNNMKQWFSQEQFINYCKLVVKNLT